MTNITWYNVEKFINNVSIRFSKSNISGVYGLPRGGLILAVMLSHKMHIPMLMAPCKDCIIIDDICDSGESLIHYVNNSSGNEIFKYHIATMFYKPNKLNIKPEYYEYYKKDEDWIVFPWES